MKRSYQLVPSTHADSSERAQTASGVSVTWSEKQNVQFTAPKRLTENTRAKTPPVLTQSDELDDGHGEVVLIRHVCVRVLLVDAVRGEAEQRQQRRQGEAEVELHRRRQLRPGLDLREETRGQGTIKRTQSHLKLKSVFCGVEGVSPVHMVWGSDSGVSVSGLETEDLDSVAAGCPTTDLRQRKTVIFIYFLQRL